jgi:RNA ligase
MERFFDPNNLPDFDNPYYEPTPKNKGEWIMATRGSFTSSQAIKGKELLEKYNFERLHTGHTYLFEIIYKENRIVCDYDYEDVVLLGMIETKTGNEINIHYDNEDVRFKNMISNIGFRVVMLYKTWGEGYDLLKEEISNDREGYVIRFRNGFRMKIKGEEYKRLHRILTNISNRDIFEYVKEGKPLDEILDKVPDEFYNWVKETKENFEQQFKTIDLEYRLIFKNITERNNITDKKTFAHYALSYSNSSILFAMYDDKDYKHIIWKLIYPSYSKPFKKDEN